MAARISGEDNRSESAEALCEAIVALPAVFPYRVAVARVGLALIAIQRGDGVAAQEQYQFLESIPRIMLLYMSTDRVLGLLATTLGNLDQAASHFEDALAFCRRAGYRPELAWACYDYADALLQRNGPGDGASALSLLEESLVISTGLGMRPLMERIVILWELAGSQPPKAPAYPDGLTPREVEVLRLISVGNSSRDVAQELVLSIRTVERHITNIYGKIGARGRADATAYALGRKLVDQM